MPQNPPVTEAERFERPYLRLFIRRDTVHRRDHGKQGNQQKEHGKHRTHGLPFLHFALRRHICHVFVLREQKRGLAERIVDFFFHLRFFKRGFYVNLRIKLISAERGLHRLRRDKRIAV